MPFLSGAERAPTRCLRGDSPGVRRILCAAVAAGLVFGAGCVTHPDRPKGECRLSADSLVFGAVTTGDSLVLEVAVANVGTAPFDLLAFLSDPDFHLETGDTAAGLAVGDTVRLAVTFAPVSPGEKAAWLALRGVTCPGVVLTGRGEAPVPPVVPEFRGSWWMHHCYPSGTLVALTAGPDGRVYVDVFESCGRGIRDRNAYPWRTIHVFSSDGELQSSWGPVVDDPGGFAVRRDGTVVLIDTWLDAVQRFSQSQKLLGQVGINCFSPGRYRTVDDLAVDSDGAVYVMDRELQRLHKVDPGGGWTFTEAFFWAEAVAADNRGHLFTMERSTMTGPVSFRSGRVMRFDTGGHKLDSWWVDNYSVAAACDLEGNVLLVQSFGSTSFGLSKFSPTGEVLARFDRGVRLNDVAVDPDGVIYALTDSVLIKNSPTGDTLAVWPTGGNAVAADRNAVFVGRGSQVFRYDPDGTPRGSWGEPGTGFGQLQGISALALAPDGSICVAERGMGRYQQFTRDGTYLAGFGDDFTEDAWTPSPSDVVTDSRGYIFVIDTERYWMQTFDADGRYLGHWGRRGSGPGEFEGSQGLAIDDLDRIYDWDAGNHRVQVFDTDGNVLSSWATVYEEGTIERLSNAQAPGCIAVGPDGSVYLTDRDRDHVVRFRNDGTPLGYWGTTGSEPGQFRHPRDVAVGPDGAVYVLESDNWRVQKFVYPETTGTVPGP